MKRGTNFRMAVELDTELDVEHIEFKFVQGSTERKVCYPGEEVTVGDDGEYLIEWTQKQTFAFEPYMPILLDTRIHITGSDYNPETEIVKLQLSETLFAEDDDCEHD